MADLSPDSPLRQALAAKAEVGLAKQIASGATPETIGHFIERRLSQLSQSDVSYLRRLADAILEAGKKIQSARAEEEFSLEDIPINGDLFGDDWEGKRLFWFGEWNVPGTDRWYPISGDSPDFEGLLGVTQKAQELAEWRFGKSPQGYAPQGGVTADDLRIRILGIERSH